MKKTIDRFTLVEALGGSGAQSTVYKASETLAADVTRTVALKVLPVIAPKEKAAEAHFLTELRALLALAGHPHIVGMLGAGISDGTPWIAMEYLPSSVSALLADQPADPAAITKIIQHVALALDAMHSQDPPLLHNDLKPANILIDKFSNYRVADFGSATMLALESTHALGTIRYAAPEVLSREFGKVCPATDLYALGQIAYELALGGRNYRRQFPAVFEGVGSNKEANPARWMAWHCSLATKATPIHDVHKEFPRRLSDIIAKLTAKPLSDRYASAKDVLAVLRPDTSQAPVSSSPPAESRAPAAARSAVAVPPAIPMEPARAAKPVLAAGANRFYVRLRGKQSGPFDLATLQRQARQGQLSRLHQVSADGALWMPATNVEGIF